MVHFQHTTGGDVDSRAPRKVLSCPSVMRDSSCIDFLQWALPQLGYRWAGFRRVRRQVCKRLAGRWAELEIDSQGAYRRYLETRPDEWAVLDGFCRITVSRFYRDREVWRVLGEEVLPRLAAKVSTTSHADLRVWSAGCGAGEEPYTLSMLCRESRAPSLREAELRVVATDLDSHQLRRARRAIFPPGSMHDLPTNLRSVAFEEIDNGNLRLRPAYRRGIDFRCQDLRREMPRGPFHVILCRNLAFTYFAEPWQRQILAQLLDRLCERGALVLGTHERLPKGVYPLTSWSTCKAVVEKT